MSIADPDPADLPRTLEELFTETVPAPLLLLVAGPWRLGPAGEPGSAADLDDPLAASLELLRRGHVPCAGEMTALPLVALPGSRQGRDSAFEEIVRPCTRLLVARCDGVVRVGGPSPAADGLVAQVRIRGGRAWSSVDAVPLVRPLVRG